MEGCNKGRLGLKVISHPMDLEVGGFKRIINLNGSGKIIIQFCF